MLAAGVACGLTVTGVGLAAIGTGVLVKKAWDYTHTQPPPPPQIPASKKTLAVQRKQEQITPEVTTPAVKELPRAASSKEKEKVIPKVTIYADEEPPAEVACSKEIVPVGSKPKLPIPVLRRIIQCLPPNGKMKFAATSKQMAILVYFDPSGPLEKMDERAVGKIPRILQLPEGIGPSERFLSSNPASAEELYKVKIVQTHMRIDPSVARTARNILLIERAHPSYYPLYHAMCRTVYCYTPLTRELLAAGYPDSEELPCRVPLIRFPNPTGPATVAELFDMYPPTDTYATKYDHEPTVQREIISLNSHLFSNLMVDGESTWFMYYEDKSVKPPSSDAFFEMLCNQYRLLPDRGMREE